jgi:hypothetical protein
VRQRKSGAKQRREIEREGRDTFFKTEAMNLAFCCCTSSLVLDLVFRSVSSIFKIKKQKNKKINQSKQKINKCQSNFFKKKAQLY